MSNLLRSQRFLFLIIPFYYNSKYGTGFQAVITPGSDQGVVPKIPTDRAGQTEQAISLGIKEWEKEKAMREREQQQRTTRTRDRGMER